MIGLVGWAVVMGVLLAYQRLTLVRNDDRWPTFSDVVSVNGGNSYTCSSATPLRVDVWARRSLQVIALVVRAKAVLVVFAKRTAPGSAWPRKWLEIPQWKPPADGDPP